MAIARTSLESENEIPILLRYRHHRQSIPTPQHNEILQRLFLMLTQIIERDDVLELAYQLHIDDEPARGIRLGVGIVVMMLGVESRLVRIALLHDGDDARYAGEVAARVIEECQIAFFYRVPQHVARLKITHAIPCGGLFGRFAQS